MKVQIRPRGPSSVRLKFMPGLRGPQGIPGDLTPEYRALGEQVSTDAAAVAENRLAVDAALVVMGQIEDAVEIDRAAAQQSNVDAYAAYEGAVAAKNIAVAAADAAQTGSVPDNGVSTVKIQDKAVTNPKLADMPANTIKGTDTAGVPKDLTVAQVAALLGAYVVPAGAVTAFARNTPPPGWLKADGTPVSRTAFAGLFAAIGTTFGAGDGSTTFNLPDLRGEFIRGWDDGRGVDASRVFGSAQADDFKAHTHAASGFSSAGGTGSVNYPVTDTTLSKAARNVSTEGGTETRPRNVALLFCIKF